MNNPTPTLFFRDSLLLFNQFRQQFISDINDLFQEQFDEEDKKGNSCKYSIIYQYYFLYFLCLYIRKQLALGETLEDVEESLDMTTIKKKLSCYNINVATYYTIFSIS